MAAGRQKVARLQKTTQRRLFTNRRLGSFMNIAQPRRTTTEEEASARSFTVSGQRKIESNDTRQQPRREKRVKNMTERSAITSRDFDNG